MMILNFEKVSCNSVNATKYLILAHEGFNINKVIGTFLFYIIQNKEKCLKFS